MARNDGVDRTVARNRDLKSHATLQNAQAHNERQKDVYSNPDIVDSRTAMNVHYKNPTGSYEEMFNALEKDNIISTWGLKPNSTKYCELVFDVNSAYFYNHGGYDLPNVSMPTPTKPQPKSSAASSTSCLRSCTQTNGTGRCQKRSDGMCTTIICMWFTFRSWKSKSYGRSVARISPWWARSRRRSCRSVGRRSGLPSLPSTRTGIRCRRRKASRF